MSTVLPRVVFLCVGNACRSPMAEGFLRHLAADRWHAQSGGVAPIGVQPETVEVMAERGIALSDLRSRYVHTLLAPPPALLVALSNEALAKAPAIPRGTEVLRWPVPDPYPVRGDRARRMAAFRATRDAIEERLLEWLAGRPPA